MFVVGSLRYRKGLIRGYLIPGGLTHGCLNPWDLTRACLIRVCQSHDSQCLQTVKEKTLQHKYMSHLVFLLRACCYDAR